MTDRNQYEYGLSDLNEADRSVVFLTYTSNALEGSALTLKETKNLLVNHVEPANISSRDSLMAVGHARACRYMMELALQKNLVVSEEYVKTMNCLIYCDIDPARAGRYRDKTAKIEQLNNAHTPEPSELPRLMGHLSDQIRSSRHTLDDVELAAMAHKRLIDIYPFDSGNFQTARLLMNLILLHSGNDMIFIEPEQKDDYLRALRLSHGPQDMEPLTQFISKRGG